MANGRTIDAHPRLVKSQPLELNPCSGGAVDDAVLHLELRPALKINAHVARRTRERQTAQHDLIVRAGRDGDSCSAGGDERRRSGRGEDAH